MGVIPPFFTQLIMGIASFIRQNIVIVGISLIGLGVLSFVAMKQPLTRQLFDNLCFSSPLIGKALRKLAVGRLFVDLGHLLSNGVSLLEAIRIASKATDNPSIRTLVETWERDVLEGRGISNSVAEFEFMPEGSHAMLIMAERTGRLESVLGTAGAFYYEEGSTQLKHVLKLTEPLIIILLGSFVGLVVASVLLPIIDVQSASSVS